MQSTFNEKKFLSMPNHWQHKRLAQLLKNIYVQPTLDSNLLNLYKLYCTWMKVEVPIPKTKKELSNLYHEHLKKAAWQLKEHDLLPTIEKGDSIPKNEFLQNAIYLDHIRSAHNVGSILRTVEALRVGSCYFSKNTPFIDHKKVQKTAMGASDIVPCYQDFSLEDLPRPFIGLETAKDANNIYSFSFPETFTLFLGNEEYGLSDEILSKIDQFVKIPLYGMKNSINVASAFAIAAGQIAKDLEK